MRTRGRKLFPGRSERPQQAWSSFTGQWRLVPIGHDERVPQLRRTWPVGFFAVMTGVSAVFISLQPLASATRAEVAGGLLVICVAPALWFARELRQWSHYRAEKEIAGQVRLRVAAHPSPSSAGRPWPGPRPRMPAWRTGLEPGTGLMKDHPREPLPFTRSFLTEASCPAHNQQLESDRVGRRA